jgi:hypothetical protein
VTVDNNLKWIDHIENVTKKIRQLTYIFRNIRDIFDMNLLKVMYYALAQSVISFGIIAWGGMAKTNLHPAVIAQKFLLRVICRKPYGYPSDDLYREFSVLDIRQLYIKTIIGHVHFNPSPYLPRYAIKINTRNAKLLQPIVTHTTFAQRFVTFLGPRIYNKVIPNILHLISPNSKNINRHVTKWLIGRGRVESENDLTCITK